MTESMPVPNPEAITAAHAELHNAFQNGYADPNDPAVLDAQRELFWHVVENGTALQTDPNAQLAMQAYGELVDYLWFQPVDAPLPGALVLADVYSEYRPDYGELVLGLEYLGPQTFDRITAVLRQHGLDKLLSARASNFARNAEAVRQALETFAGHTPAGTWL